MFEHYPKNNTTSDKRRVRLIKGGLLVTWTKWKVYILGLAVVALIGVVFFAVKFSPSVSKKAEFNQVMRSAAGYIKDNPEQLSHSVQSVEDFYSVEGDAIVWVNDLPISKEEFDFRRGLQKISEIPDVDQYIFNILIEEKIVLDYAINNEIVPTDEQLKEFINYERDPNQTGEEYQEAVKAFCEVAGMTEDEYYDSYEKYNAFRLLLYKNAYDFAVKEGRENGKLTLDPNDDITLRQDKEVQYWNDLQKELKGNIDIRVNDKYKDLMLVVDKTRLYILSAY